MKRTSSFTPPVDLDHVVKPGAAGDKPSEPLHEAVVDAIPTTASAAMSSSSSTLDATAEAGHTAEEGESPDPTSHLARGLPSLPGIQLLAPKGAVAAAAQLPEPPKDLFEDELEATDLAASVEGSVVEVIGFPLAVAVLMNQLYPTKFELKADRGVVGNPNPNPNPSPNTSAQELTERSHSSPCVSGVPLPLCAGESGVEDHRPEDGGRAGKR